MDIFTGGFPRTRRFAPLFITQFLGAFNDNLLKSALAIVVTYRLAEQSGLDAASLVIVAGGLFIAPFFLFSGASGTLADQVDKAVIARWVKVAEMAIMALGAWGLWQQSLSLLLATLFALGVHSTVFGPIKYALLPQHLRDEELVAGNALIEAGTFLAILCGTILGGSLVLVANGALIVGGCGVITAVAAAVLLAWGVTIGELFAICGLATLPVAVLAAWVLKRQLTKQVLRLVLRLLYRVRVEGVEHAREALPHAVIVANHASFFDGLLLGAFLPGDPIFAVDTQIAAKWWVRPFLSLVHAAPVDPTNPLSIRTMIRAVEGGSSCIIFPEG